MRKYRYLLIGAFLVFTAIIAGCFGETTSSSSEEAEAEYTRGTLTENSFESKFLNLRFTLPDGFNIISETDLNALNASRGFAKDLDFMNEYVVYEMIAMTPINVPSVSVIVEKLSVMGITIEAYIEDFKEEMLKGGFDNISFADETIKVKFAGETYTQVNVTLYVLGTEINQKYLFRQIDDRVVNIVATYTPETEAEMQILLDAFDSF